MDDAGDEDRPGRHLRDRTETVGGPLEGTAAPTDVPPRWRVLRKVGEGGQAAVFLAEDSKLGIPVALKVFSGSQEGGAGERIRREVRLGRELSHPHLIRTFDFVEFGGHVAVALEWMPGGSLSDELRRGPFAIERVILVASQVLDVLAYLHDKKVVHRDVKPSNLLIGADGAIRLADLGLARLLVKGATLTNSAALVGTPAYLSPEQVLGKEVGPPSDLYSLGVTLFELLTGTRPFGGESDFGAVLSRVAKGGVPSVRTLRPDCPGWMASFVERLLEREPANRFPDAGSALSAFNSRRFSISPRAKKRAGGAVAALLVATAVTLGLHGFLRRIPASAAIQGRDLVAWDKSGREVWRRTLIGVPGSVEVGDIADGPEPEVITSVGLDGPAGPKTKHEIVVFRPDGTERIRFSAGVEEFAKYYPRFQPKECGVNLHPFPATRRGEKRDFVWGVKPSIWYPWGIGLWSSDSGFAPHLIYLHSGHLPSQPVEADLDGDGTREILVAGVNNVLGHQSVVAILRQPEEKVSGPDFSPDLLDSFSSREGRGTLAYVPLGPRGGSERVLMSTDGITLHRADMAVSLDRAGNPIKSPLWSRGAEPRHRFWAQLENTCRRIESGSQDFPGALRELFPEHQSVMEERPMKAASGLLVARSLARNGRFDRSARLLSELAQELPEFNDLQYRAAEMYYRSGGRKQAYQLFSLITRESLKGRHSPDVALMWGRLAAGDGDRESFEQALRVFAARQSEAHVSRNIEFQLEGLWSFWRGEWHLWRSEFLATGNFDFFQELEILALWARVELGEEPAGIRRMAEDQARHSERREVAGLLSSYCLLKEGRASQAKTQAEVLLQALRKQGREDMESYIWIPLAEWVIGASLESMGDTASAQLHFKSVVEQAPRTWMAQRVRKAPRTDTRLHQ